MNLSSAPARNSTHQARGALLTGGIDDRVGAIAPVAVALLAVVAMATSLRNGFAYDDVYIIANNARVHSLDAWWAAFHETYWPPPNSPGLYRPLTILGFAVQWALGGGRTWVFHATSVLGYAATAVAVYYLLAELVSRRAALLGAAVFAVHPVHVEAVANVVGQAEVFSALWTVLGVLVYLRARRAGPLRATTIAWLALLYAAACWTKEHGVLLLPFLALAEIALVRDERPFGVRARALLPTGVVLGAVLAAFIVARATAPGVLSGARLTGQLINFDFSVRFFSFLGVVPEWARLFLWPLDLSADYSPQHLRIQVMWQPGLLPGVAICVAVALALVLSWPRDRVATFALGWLVASLSLASGLVVPIGVLLAERMLFLPSVGVALLAGWGAARLEALDGGRWRRARPAAAALAVLLVAAGAVRSAVRAPVWRDNHTLFLSMPDDAPLSFRAHWMRGSQLFAEGMAGEGEKEMLLAIRLNPVQPSVHADLAQRYRLNGMCPAAIPHYRAAIRLNDGVLIFATGLARCYLVMNEPDSASAVLGRLRGGLESLPEVQELRRIADSAATSRRGGSLAVRR